MYKIGDFSQIGKVSVRMLRHYDKIDLLKPGHIDPWTGYRYYTIDQLPRLHQILAFHDLGLSLEQVGHLLDDSAVEQRLHTMLQAKQAKLEAQLAEEQARLARWVGMNGYGSTGFYRELHHFGRELETSTDIESFNKKVVIEIIIPVEKL